MKAKHLHTILLVAIVSINGYIIITPFLPNLLFKLHRPNAATTAALEATISSQATTHTSSPAPTDNKLIIPALGLDEPIHTGPTATTLRQGLWLRPQGSSPDKGSNTVIVGHRFTYTNPRGALYHLDKIRTGDTIGVTWQGTMHAYKVTGIKVVKANDTSVEAPTPTAQLTIYTCTPLWLPKDRLVVTAEEIAS